MQCTNVTDRRQTTDGRAIAYSEREREFTFANNNNNNNNKEPKVAGSLLADRAEASPAHHSSDPESLHYKHPGVRSESSNGLATAQGTDRVTDRT